MDFIPSLVSITIRSPFDARADHHADNHKNANSQLELIHYEGDNCNHVRGDHNTIIPRPDEYASHIDYRTPANACTDETGAATLSLPSSAVISNHETPKPATTSIPSMESPASTNAGVGGQESISDTFLSAFPNPTGPPRETQASAAPFTGAAVHNHRSHALPGILFAVAFLL